MIDKVLPPLHIPRIKSDEFVKCVTLHMIVVSSLVPHDTVLLLQFLASKRKC